ncbi:MAG: helix-turn-helix transcriptional regulator [Oscillospiraceae bacterium]|nr:helix-turn-helix transcriptional regulator [Oscillospiraceae bacterium]
MIYIIHKKCPNYNSKFVRYRDEAEKLDLDILARICYVLECTPSYILEYSGEENK